MKFTNHHVSDMVARIRNAILRKHDCVKLPNIRIVKAILIVLQEQGYIVKFNVEKNTVIVFLKYIKDCSVITKICVVSKPSNRVYKKNDNIPFYFNGLGITIVSTSKGIIAGDDAQKLEVGGEILCQVF